MAEPRMLDIKIHTLDGWKEEDPLSEAVRNVLPVAIKINTFEEFIFISPKDNVKMRVKAYNDAEAIKNRKNESYKYWVGEKEYYEE